MWQQCPTVFLFRRKLISDEGVQRLTQNVQPGLGAPRESKTSQLNPSLLAESEERASRELDPTVAKALGGKGDEIRFGEENGLGCFRMDGTHLEAFPFSWVLVYFEVFSFFCAFFRNGIEDLLLKNCRAPFFGPGLDLS